MDSNDDQRDPVAERIVGEIVPPGVLPGEQNPPKMEPSGFRSVWFKDLFKILVLRTLFIYSIYPLFSAMVISTDTLRRLNRNLVSGLCQTTGTLPQFLQRVGLITVCQRRVGELADALVTLLSASFGTVQRRCLCSSFSSSAGRSSRKWYPGCQSTSGVKLFSVYPRYFLR